MTSGAPGTCATNGTVGLNGSDTAPAPAPFTAPTVTAYATPAHNPPNNPALSVEDTELVNGPAHPDGTLPVEPCATDALTEYDDT